MIVDAVALLVRTWQTEQRHEELSTYRYSELPRAGKGPPSKYTGGQPAAESERLDAENSTAWHSYGAYRGPSGQQPCY
jgi:hypothetical protein